MLRGKKNIDEKLDLWETNVGFPSHRSNYVAKFSTNVVLLK